MARQTYYVTSEHGVSQGEKTIAKGQPIELDEQAARPLIRVGAIRTDKPAEESDKAPES